MSNSSSVPPFRFENFTGKGLAILRRFDDSGDDDNEQRKRKAEDLPITTFTHLAFTFPLKLISPRSASRDAYSRITSRLSGSVQKAGNAIKPVAVLYVVGYGGGLVSGDTVEIDTDVGKGCTLLMLTQGSTKVYKMRGKRSVDLISPSTITSQTFRCIIRENSTMVVLPDPVTCYANSNYKQIQKFDVLDLKSSSLILLDWFTPGRVHLKQRDGQTAKSEKWSFDLYHSKNEVRVAGEVLVKDILELKQEKDFLSAGNNEGNSIARKCEPYTCFAMLLLYGKDVEGIVESIKTEFHSIQQHNRSRMTSQNQVEQDVLWSSSPLTKAGEDEQAFTGGLIVRIAGLTTESVRSWLRTHLEEAKDIIGDDLYRQALG